MSIRIQLQQPLWRHDDNPPAGDVDRRADVLRQRHQHLSAARLEHQAAAGGISFDVFHRSDLRAICRFDEAPDQLVPVERALGQRHQPINRYPELQARERCSPVHVVDALQSHHRPFSMKADARERQRLDHAATTDEELGARLKPLLRKIGLGIHDHLALEAVRPCDSPDQRHGVPVNHCRIAGLQDCRK